MPPLVEPPVFRAVHTSRVGCPVCDVPPRAGELIAKRWGRWTHEECYRRLSSAERWAITQRANGVEQ